MKESIGEATVMTTVGELVESVMEASLEVIDDEKEASAIAGIVLNNILKSSYQSAFFLERGLWPRRDS